MTGQSEHLPGDVQGEPASTSRLICRELLTCGNDRLRIGFWLCGEPSAVIEWTDPETADERSAHTLLVPEAAVERDTLNRDGRLLQGAAGRLQPHRFDRLGRCRPRLRGEEASKGTRAHAGALGQLLDPQISGEVLGNPRLEREQPAVLIAPRGCHLRGERCAELRLATGALQEHHEPLRHLHRQPMPKILLHQRQGQVDPSGHTGRGPDVAVTDEDRIGFHPYVWVVTADVILTRSPTEI